MSTRVHIQTTLSWHPLTIATLLIRVSLALYILVHPLWGFLWSMVFDYLDSQILIHVVRMNRMTYQRWDKCVDWCAYATQLVVAARYGFFVPFLFLFLYRFVGFVGFMRTNKRVYFIFFPNLFDMAFLWMLLFSPATPWVWLALLFFAKEVHEFILHYWWPHADPTEG